MNDSDLLARAKQYVQTRRLQLDESGTLGFGQDGTIWRTTTPTAIKVFRREQAYFTELACYERLGAHNITRIEEFSIPGLVDSDDELQVIEMDIVSRPFLLDFGKCYLDRKPEFSPEVWQDWQIEHAEMWEDRWKTVRRLVWQLEKYGIYHVDPRPGNIRFADQ